MIKIVAHFFIKPDFVNKTDALFSEIVEKSRKENGCISYELFSVDNEIGHFVFIETWKDKTALDSHNKSEHFTRIIAELTKMSQKDALIAVMKQVL